jgi:RNA polymerase sigma factor (sigma-70 family)
MQEKNDDIKSKLTAVQDMQDENAAIYARLNDVLIEKEFLLLVNDCLSNKRESQKKLYYVFYEFAVNICMRYAGNREDALEIMNDGFLKVFKKLDTFKFLHNNPIIGFKAWVKKIMIYTSIDYLRKKSRLKYTVVSEETVNLPVYDESQLEKLSCKEIMESIQNLSPGYRAVFCLFVIDGFTHEEIARRLGIAVGTSKSNLAKARANLKQKLMNRQNFNNYESRAV